MKPVHVALAVVVAAVWGVNFVVIDVGLRDFPPLLFSAVRFLLAALPAVFFVGRPRVAWRWVIAVGVTLGIMKFGMLFIGMHAGLPGTGLPGAPGPGGVHRAFRRGTAEGTRPAGADRRHGHRLGGYRAGRAGFDGRHTGRIPAGRGRGGVLGPVQHRDAEGQSAGYLPLHGLGERRTPIPLALLSVPFEGWDADLRALQHLNLSGVGAALYVAWGATLFGFAAWGYLLRTYNAPTVAPFSLLVPVFGLAAAWIFQGERMTVLTFCATALVITGIAVGMVRRSKKPMAPEPEPTAVTAAAP